jgi:Tetracyclin repressor-like, C-terminal domain
MNVRPGPVRDHIADFVARWMQAIEDAVREAQSLGEIAPQIDPTQLAFETNALLVAANLAFPLFGDPTILQRARLGVRERLRTAAAIAQRLLHPHNLTIPGSRAIASARQSNDAASGRGDRHS